MKGVRTSTIQPYKIIVRCEQRDGPPRPSAHHVTGRLKKKKKKKKKKILAGPMIMIVSWAIENNLVYFDCFVIVSWAIEI